MRDLTKGNEGSLIFRFAIPMLLGNVFQQLYQVVDSIIVGKILGKQALAAVGASFPIIFALIALIIGVAMGGTIIVSQYYGAKDMAKVKRTIDTLYVFLFVASVSIALLGIYFSEDIFRIMKLPEVLIPDAVTYLNIYLAGMVVFFGFNGTSAVLRGLGDSVTPVIFLIISVLLNIVLVIVFILVFHWGIAGAAWATVISQTCAFIAIIIYLNRSHEVISFSIKNIEFDKAIFYQCLRIGLPSGLQQTFVALGMMAMMGIVNTFGTDVIAAYTAASRVDSFATMFAMSFSMALSTFVGQNLGAGRYDRIKTGYWKTLWISNAICVGATLLIIIFKLPLMHIFTDDPMVISIGAHYLAVVSAFYLLFSIMFVTSGVMRGAGATLIPMFITLFSLWLIRIPLAYFLSSKIGYAGLWWAIPIAWLIGTVGTLTYYNSGKWKNKGVVKSSLSE